MAKQIVYGDASRQGILRGINSLANAVRVTLGPRGRNVILGRPFGPPTITKDGVTVAKEIELKDALENMGAQMVKEVASKTSDVAGDGTTTATVLAQAIYREGARNVTAGANPMALKRGIDKAVDAMTAELQKMSKPVTGPMIAQVGTISANHDEAIGRIIGDAMEKPMRWIAANAGHEGSVIVERVRAMKGAEGFNAQTERYENLVAAGVIDPTKVVRSALQHAASIASLLLTTEAVISLIPERHRNATSATDGMGSGAY